MNKIFDKEVVNDIYDRNIIDVIEWLSAPHHFPRSKGAMLIAVRINENYPEYSTLLLKEMKNDIHFEPIRFGIKSAWTIAIVLIENLKSEDYPKIKQAFDTWDAEEKEGLLEYLRNHPEHRKVLNGS
jgi:hypothetical protein